MHLGVIIAAGGVGSRMGAGGSKQLMQLAGRPVLARTAAIFEEQAVVEEIVIVIDEGDLLRCRMEVVDRYGLSKVRAVVPGGAERALSVAAGLASLGPEINTVAVHDGARPLFPGELLADGLSALECGCEAGELDGVVFGLPVTDTIKQTIAGGLVSNTPDRTNLWAAQTPQIFWRPMLQKAYSAPKAQLAASTDDASLVEQAGGQVMMVHGSRENIKLTEPADILLAEAILRRREDQG